MNALGFASNKALEARANVARSCDCVAAIATSLSDCPGRIVYWLPASSGAEAATAAAALAASAVAACAPDAPVKVHASAAAAAI